MGTQVDIVALREACQNRDKYRAFEREVIGGIAREVDDRKGKAERERINREKKAKRKRQRAAASML
ncbi:MAG TPA: hypothetical protein PLZ36_12820 [Armatimonadota bacterium]|nr:hypothetical protein [Armatimonadota bacterium]HOS42530.1 hypothetical protein [Armatimonadota bacterium]